MKKILIAVMVMAALGCAKVSVETTKPIKVDVTMRIDIYQHVEKEASSIEDQIYGKKDKQLNSLLAIMVPEAYAQENSPAEINEAIERRKARAGEIEGYFNKGYAGEKLDGLLQVMEDVPEEVSEKVAAAVKEENRDRMIIYSATADSNKLPLEETQLFFYADHYQRAKKGCWFEVKEKDGSIVWKKK